MNIVYKSLNFYLFHTYHCWYFFLKSDDCFIKIKIANKSSLTFCKCLLEHLWWLHLWIWLYTMLKHKRKVGYLQRYTSYTCLTSSKIPSVRNRSAILIVLGRWSAQKLLDSDLSIIKFTSITPRLSRAHTCRLFIRDSSQTIVPEFHYTLIWIFDS